MTAPVQPRKPKMPIALYREALASGWTDEDILADGEYDLPFGSTRTPAQRVTPVRSMGERVKGSVAAAAQTAIPVAGPIAVKMAGLDDEAEATRAATREKVGTGPLLAAELAGGIASGNSLMNLLGKADKASRAAQLAKVALGGSQNTKRGVREWVKRLAVNMGSGAATGAATASDGNEGAGALIGLGAGMLPSAVEGVIGLKNATMNRVAPTAGQRLQRAAGDDVDDLLTRAKARAATDPDALLADVTEEHGTALLEDAVRRGGREGSLTRAALGDRAAKAVDARAVTKSVADAAGINPNQGVRGAQAEVDAAKRPAVTALFRETVDEGSDFFDDPRLQAMLEQGDPDMARAAQRALAHTKTSRAATGRRVPSEYAGTDFFDRLRKELGDIETSYRTGANPDIGAAKMVALRKQEVEDILTERLGPKYAEGIRRAAENFKTQEALEQGAKMARSGDDAIKDADLAFSRELEMRQPPTATSNTEIQGAQRQGAAHAIVNQLERAKSPEALLDILASSPQHERTLEFAIPDPHARESLLRDLNARLEKLYRARRLAGAAPIPDLERPNAFGNLTPWSIASAMRGSPTLAAAQVAGTLMEKVMGRLRRSSSEELAALARERLAGPGGSLNPRITQALTDRGRRQTINPRLSTQTALLRAGVVRSLPPKEGSR